MIVKEKYNEHILFYKKMSYLKRSINVIVFPFIVFHMVVFHILTLR